MEELRVHSPHGPRRRRALSRQDRMTATPSPASVLWTLAKTCMLVLAFGLEFQGRTLALSTPKPKYESRYFAQEGFLPPLRTIDVFGPANATSSCTESRDLNESDLPVLYTNNPKMVSRWLADYVPSTGCSLGFDVESVPDMPWLKKKASFSGPATVQLATPEATLVVHLARNTGRPSKACVPLLEAVLRDERIIKAGCGVDQDMVELHRKFRGLEARSRLELGGIGASDKGETLGLKKLAASILGVDLPKSRRLATSNWSQVPLTQAQVAYSARDAWAAAAIVDELAAHDPTTFATDALVERLSSQRSVKDLSRRQRKRKQAKNQLSSLLAPYSPRHKSKAHKNGLPSWKVETVRELKNVMKENRFEQHEFIDVEPLGFSIRSDD